MATKSFSNMFKILMFGNLQEKGAYKLTAPLFDAMKFLNVNLSNKTAQLSFNKLMGKGFSASAKAGLKVKGKLGAKGGLKLKMKKNINIGAKTTTPKVKGGLKLKVGG